MTGPVPPLVHRAEARQAQELALHGHTVGDDRSDGLAC
jgi:hypothetical protein